MSEYGVTVTIDLAAKGLQHAGEEECGCGGQHSVDVSLDLESTDLHMDGECPEPPRIVQLTPALQKLHELAHPEGAVYIENCTEQVCRDARGVRSW